MHYEFPVSFICILSLKNGVLALSLDVGNIPSSAKP
jgi:hypothetical protein